MSDTETRRLLEKQFENLDNEILAENEMPEEMKGLGDDRYSQAPSAYKKEYGEIFASLPLELRKYLHEREGEVEEKFSQLSVELKDKSFLEEAFGKKGAKRGFKNSRDWMEKLIMAEDMLDQNPEYTLSVLAKAYGVSLGSKPVADVTELKIAMLMESFKSLQQKFEEKENQAKQILENAKEAEKSKDAALVSNGRAPKMGKFDGLSVRQMLEKQFAELEE